MAVAVGVLVSGAAWADEAGPAADLDARVRVAILPLVVNSIGEQGYLRSGLADMLASRLGRNSRIAVVRVEGDSQATSDPKRAAAVGLELGAQYVIFGSFTQFGEGASLDVQCVEARAYEKKEDPEARRVFIQSGTVGEIIPKLDATAQKIGLYVAGPAAPSAPAVADVAAGPPVAAAASAAPASVGNEAGYEDLRRRVESLEEYLFGGQGEGKAEAAPEAESPPEDASQEFGLR